MLNYEKYEFIKMLLVNRERVYYLTRYHQAENVKEKDAIREEMRLKNIYVDGRTTKGAKGDLKASDKNKTEE